MLNTKTAINISSQLNEWIDFTILIAEYEDFNKVLGIVNSSYDEYWESDSCDTIADFICNALDDNKADYEIYFKQLDAEEVRSDLKNKVYDSYSEETDMTTIFEDTFDLFGMPVSTEVKGFYFGKPTKRETKEYYGKLKAEY